MVLPMNPFTFEKLYNDAISFRSLILSSDIRLYG